MALRRYLSSAKQRVIGLGSRSNSSKSIKADINGTKPNDTAPVNGSADNTQSRDVLVDSGTPPQQPPAESAKATAAAAAVAGGPTLRITLRNNTASGNVSAYITGQAIDNGNAVFLLQADGSTPYYPGSPSAVQSPLSADVSIRLGAPGTSRTVTIPRIAGGRIWFAIDGRLTFLLNPGADNRPGLVEPSVQNTSDPNYNVNWSFAEFTYNAAQLYANISMVDFVSFPISLSLRNEAGNTQDVVGLPKDGLNTICDKLRQQSQADGNAGWAGLVIPGPGGAPLRALSANAGFGMNAAAFGSYYDGYVDAVARAYANNRPFTVHIQEAHTGTFRADGSCVIDGETFARPSTQDILSSNSGPFATGPSPLRNTLIPQLAAAWNRSSWLVSDQVPSARGQFYADRTTNQYSRIVHEVVSGGKGYAFPYDDVPPGDGGDQSGYVNDERAVELTVTVGGA